MPFRLLRDERFIRATLQVVALVLVIVAFYVLAQNVNSALAEKNLQPRYTFLNDRAGFSIGGAEGYYSPDDSYWRAFTVGLENTIRVVIVGLPLATILGIVFGIALLTRNFLIRSIAQVYVEILRNTPLLVQLFAWYFIAVLALPAIRNAIEFPSQNPIVSLSNRGIVFPEILTTPRFGLFGIFVAIGVALAAMVWIESGRVTERTGRPIPKAALAAGLIVVVALVGYVVASLPEAPRTVTIDRGGQTMEVAVSDALSENLLTIEQRAALSRTPLMVLYPVRAGLRYSQGTLYSSEYIALLLGLAVYTSAFIAEIVRAGIQSVDRGQVEASRALGIKPNQTLTMIILPQALRVIIPPLGNQYLNLAKNSSLAIAISFADLFQVSNTIINQSGQTVSIFSLVMGAYLLMSLLISWVMNTINSRFELVTRNTISTRPLRVRVVDGIRRFVTRSPAHGTR
jgi:general L-amino acid transport system permease protein